MSAAEIVSLYISIGLVCGFGFALWSQYDGDFSVHPPMVILGASLLAAALWLPIAATLLVFWAYHWTRMEIYYTRHLFRLHRLGFRMRRATDSAEVERLRAELTALADEYRRML